MTGGRAGRQKVLYCNPHTVFLLVRLCDFAQSRSGMPHRGGFIVSCAQHTSTHLNADPFGKSCLAVATMDAPSASQTHPGVA